MSNFCIKPAISMAAANGGAALAPPLSASTITQRVVKAEYAVRGEIVRRASVIEEELQSGKGSYPFSKVVWCNIGNPQILGQQPITYFRQVLCLCEYPQVCSGQVFVTLRVALAGKCWQQAGYRWFEVFKLCARCQGRDIAGERQ